MPTTLKSPNTKLPTRFNRDHDKPAMLGTKHSAFDTPSDADDELHFDYELKDPLSFYGAAAVGVAAILLMSVIGLAIWLWK
jgi:hypothetical protein